MNRILVPVDGSEQVKRALLIAIEFVKRCGTSEIELLNVQSPAPSFWPEKLITEDILQAHYATEGAKTLQAAERLLREAGVSYHSEVRVGQAAEMIAHYAREKNVDGIVMGTRGMGTMKGLVLGSVATGVLHLVSLPVTLVK
jgi:nucleotide-binding universal stress UspA family protein